MSRRVDDDFIPRAARAAAAIVEPARQQGRNEERARIVEWLREQEERQIRHGRASGMRRYTYHYAAAQIETGAHWPVEGGDR